MTDSSLAVGVILALTATYLLHSTLLLATAWLVSRVARRRYALCERLWRVAAVLGLLTAPIQVALGPSWMQLELLRESSLEFTRQASTDAGSTLLESLNEGRILKETSSERVAASVPAPAVAVEGEQFDHAAVEIAAAASTTPADDTLLLPPDSAAGRSRPAVGSSGDVEVVSLRADPWRRDQGLAITAYFIVAITLIGLCRFLFQEWFFQRRLRRAPRLVDGPVRRQLDCLVVDCRLRRRVHLLIAPELASPAACGVWRWTILVPRDLADRIHSEELRALLLHELAHLARGDTRWLLVGRLICNCLCFQPLNLLSRRRWREASEFLCDDWTVTQGVGQLVLARTLTKVAEWKLDASEGVVVLAAAGSSQIFRRVQHLLEGRRSPDIWATPDRKRWSLLVVVAAAVLAILAAPGVALPRRLASAPAGAAAPTADGSEPWQGLEADLLALQRELHTARRLADEADVINDVRRMTSDLERRAAMLTEEGSRLRAAAQRNRE